MRRFPIEGILKLLERENNFVFLETTKCDAENFLSYLFLRPKETISTFKLDEINDCFARLDKALKAGLYVAGFLSYEAGEVFEERLRHRASFDFPLLWFGIYNEPLVYNHRKKEFQSSSAKTCALIKKIIAPKTHSQKNYLLKNIRPNISQSSYSEAITKIKNLIAEGFTYQVNYTFKLKFSFSGSPGALYFNLRNNQSVAYSTLIKTNRYSLVSFSPELFFKKKGRTIITRPMKGTIARGRNLEEDVENIKQLKNCLKNRSENLMIVDLLRNDLGRISTVGSVRVPYLFNVERYETLFQMTSDIKSRLRPYYSVFDIFRNIFPSGSVTGAPKIKTMEIIRQLEKEPRRVYTGSIGFFSPHGSGVFNVAIRTILIDYKTASGEMGVGSGIVYDSESVNEYAECRLKANFLTEKTQIPELIETMLWQPSKGYLFLRLHLRRLKNSARYFNFRYYEKDIIKALRRLQNQFGHNNYRVMIVLFKDGEIHLESSVLESQQQGQPKVYLATKRTTTGDHFLYHKTTSRKIYDQEYKRCRRLDCYDAIFTNEKGELTEGTISNLFIKKNGSFYTPPLECGLLNGVYRQYMLATKRYRIKEKILFPHDLQSADEIYLSNSVRGLVKVQLEDKNH